MNIFQKTAAYLSETDTDHPVGKLQNCLYFNLSQQPQPGLSPWHQLWSAAAHGLHLGPAAPEGRRPGLEGGRAGPGLRRSPGAAGASGLARRRGGRGQRHLRVDDGGRGGCVLGEERGGRGWLLGGAFGCFFEVFFFLGGGWQNYKHHWMIWIDLWIVISQSIVSMIGVFFGAAQPGSAYSSSDVARDLQDELEPPERVERRAVKQEESPPKVERNEEDKDPPARCRERREVKKLALADAVMKRKGLQMPQPQAPQKPQPISIFDALEVSPGTSSKLQIKRLGGTGPKIGPVMFHQVFPIYTPKIFRPKIRSIKLLLKYVETMFSLIWYVLLIHVDLCSQPLLLPQPLQHKNAASAGRGWKQGNFQKLMLYHLI